MTETGLAAKEGTLQEGDLILKVNISTGGMKQEHFIYLAEFISQLTDFFSFPRSMG